MKIKKNYYPLIFLIIFLFFYDINFSFAEDVCCRVITTKKSPPYPGGPLQSFEPPVVEYNTFKDKCPDTEEYEIGVIKYIFQYEQVDDSMCSPSLLPDVETKIIYSSTPIRVCPPSIFGSQKCTYPDLISILQTLQNFILNISPYLLSALIILGGLIYIFVVFNPSYVQKGHNYIKFAIVGYFLLLILSAIFTLISRVIGGP